MSSSYRARILATMVILALVGVTAGTGTFSAFTATSVGTDNRIESGSVQIDDNDGGAAMFDLSGGQRGTSETRCIVATYSGSLDAEVRLYGDVSGELAPYLTLTVTRGSDSAPSFADCTNFTADAVDYIGEGDGVIYNGSLAAYPAETSASILVDPVASSPETWTTDEEHAYRFRVTVDNTYLASNRSATATFYWEAHDQ